MLSATLSTLLLLCISNQVCLVALLVLYGSSPHNLEPKRGNSTRIMPKIWSNRPLALGVFEYAQQSAWNLQDLYETENEQEQHVKVPARPPRGVLRVCQWNVQSFQYCDHGQSCAREIAHALLKIEPDIIVLNEYCSMDPQEPNARLLEQELRDNGYPTLHVAQGEYPTAVLTRLEVDVQDDFSLKTTRNAVVLRVKVPYFNQYVWLYGTHLNHFEDMEGHRLREMRVLTNRIGDDLDQVGDSLDSVPVLIVGDFNQQRAIDYTTQEWESIVQSKERRREASVEDGVDHHLQHDMGFVCAWDAFDDCNWNPNHPPPATHWSGTVIDYAYSKNLRAQGVYVSPVGLSDHRLCVTDWKLPET